MRAPVLALASILLLGCGGAFAPAEPGGDGGPAADGGGTGDGSPHDSAPPGDSGPLPDGGGPDVIDFDAAPPWSPICPPSAPAIGSACSLVNAECEYGGAWWSVSCDTVVRCDAGQWTLEHPSFESCTPEPGPNAPACPATYASVPMGASCTDTSLSCVYAQGLCSCQIPLGGPVMLDGGSGYWGCVPGSGCPFPRPRIGSACGAASGTYCTYEACSYGQSCQGGVWVPEQEACAGAASP